MKKIIWVVILSLIFGFTALAEAVLIDRGGGLIYDSTNDITWLQDASYAMTSGYDPDGQMNWDDAMTWAENLQYVGPGGVILDDWRLPEYYDPVNYKSEMSDLYDQGVNPQNPGHFNNLQGTYYWLGTEWQLGHYAAWAFNFTYGNHGTINKVGSELNAWAVHDGDVGAASVPEPATGLLFLSLILGIAGMKRIGQRHGAFYDSVN